MNIKLVVGIQLTKLGWNWMIDSLVTNELQNTIKKVVKSIEFPKQISNSE